MWRRQVCLTVLDAEPTSMFDRGESRAANASGLYLVPSIPDSLSLQPVRRFLVFASFSLRAGLTSFVRAAPVLARALPKRLDAAVMLTRPSRRPACLARTLCNAERVWGGARHCSGRAVSRGRSPRARWATGPRRVTAHSARGRPTGTTTPCRGSWSWPSRSGCAGMPGVNQRPRNFGARLCAKASSASRRSSLSKQRS